MPRHTRRTPRRLAHGLALSAVASMAVLAPTAALADDESPDDVDTSESTTTTTEPTPEVTESTSLLTAPADESTDTDEPAAEVKETGDEDGEQVDDVVAEQEVAVSAEDADDEDEPIEPDMGFGKFNQPIRIGVGLADDTYVPDGVTTAGSVVRIVERGPLVPDGELVTECTTQASTAQGTATFCEFEEPTGAGPGPIQLFLRGVGRSEVGTLARTFPENADSTQDDQVYFAARSSTVTVTQISVSSGLVGDPDVASVQPCDDEAQLCTRQVALLEDTGLPPVAADDRATTREDTPVTIDVLGNDDTVAGAPLTGFDFASAPSDGSVEIVGTESAPQVRYTPDEGFSGTDTFSYGFTTPNGTAFADVTVVVRPDADPAAGDRATAATVSGMPNAGGPGWSMFAWAAALLAAGAGVLTAGRRRAAR